jgi:hypothetical protein
LRSVENLIFIEKWVGDKLLELGYFYFWDGFDVL